MEFLSYVKLPNLKRVFIQYVDKKLDTVARFLNSSFPNTVEDLFLNGGLDKPSFKIDDLQPSLSRFLPGVQNRIHVSNVQMDSSSLSNFIKAAKHIKEVNISNGNIHVNGQIDFGQHLHYYIKQLCLFGTGNSNNSSWRTNKQDMIDIFKAIKNTHLSKSIESLLLSDCGWSNSEMKKILESDEVGLGHIKLNCSFF